MNPPIHYYLHYLKNKIYFVICILNKISELHLFGLNYYYIPTEIKCHIILFIFETFMTCMDISCGSFHSLVLHAGQLITCGANDNKQQGLKNIERTKFNVSLNNVLSIFSGYNSSFILTKDGLYGTGYEYLNTITNKKGHKITGTTFKKIVLSCKKTKIKFYENGQKKKDILIETIEIKDFITMKVGYGFLFILTKEGLFGNGSNYSGQLGINYTDLVHGFVKIDLKNVLKISCGRHFTMVLTKEGLFSSGTNFYGQLGLGLDIGPLVKKSNTFTKINIENVIAVDCANNFVLVLTKEGLYACGKTKNIRPFLLNYINNNDGGCHLLGKCDLKDVISFKCGKNFYLVLTDQGFYGCGNNKYNQLGYCSWNSPYEFKKIDLKLPLLLFACGGHHSIMLTIDFMIIGNGCNKYNQIGARNTNKTKKCIDIHRK